MEHLNKVVEPICIHIRPGANSNNLRKEITEKLSDKQGFINLFQMAIAIASTIDRCLWTHRTWDHLCGIGKLVRVGIRAGYRYQLEIKHEPREDK